MLAGAAPPTRSSCAFERGAGTRCTKSPALSLGPEAGVVVGLQDAAARALRVSAGPFSSRHSRNYSRPRASLPPKTGKGRKTPAAAPRQCGNAHSAAAELQSRNIRASARRSTRGTWAANPIVNVCLNEETQSEARACIKRFALHRHFCTGLCFVFFLPLSAVGELTSVRAKGSPKTAN